MRTSNWSTSGSNSGSRSRRRNIGGLDLRNQDSVQSNNNGSEASQDQEVKAGQLMHEALQYINQAMKNLPEDIEMKDEDANGLPQLIQLGQTVDQELIDLAQQADEVNLANITMWTNSLASPHRDGMVTILRAIKAYRERIFDGYDSVATGFQNRAELTDPILKRFRKY